MKPTDDILAAVRLALESGVSGRANSAAMTSLVAATSRLPLSELDFWERAIRAELWAMDRKLEASPWKFWNRKTRFASWLDLCSGSGFQREHILRAATDGVPNRFFFALALRRLNDWVPQVRAAAREHVLATAQRTEPEYVVDALWSTLAHCNSWGRLETADRDVLINLTATEPFFTAIKSRIIESAAGPATSVLGQAWRGPAFDLCLNEIARNAIQPAVRGKAYRSILAGKAVWSAGRRWKWTDVRWAKGHFEPVIEERELSRRVSFFETLDLALADPSSLVRAVAAESLIRALGSSEASELVAPAQRLASDPSPFLAARGRFALGKLQPSA